MKMARLLSCTVVLTVLPVTWTAQADDGLCVSCDGPSASYYCTVKKAKQIEMVAGAKALNKICTKVIAKTAPHKNCRVTGATASNCPGTPKRIDWKTVKAALAAEAQEDKDKSSEQAERVTSPPPPPQTKDRAEAAAKRQEPPEQAAEKDEPPAKKPNLADGITNAAEKTWECVSSLFGKCL